MDSPKIKVSTIVRTVVLAIVLVNQVLTSMGWNQLPFSEDTAGEFLSALLTVLVSAWAWWKNNSFTKAARVGDELMVEVKETQR